MNRKGVPNHGTPVFPRSFRFAWFSLFGEWLELFFDLP